MTLELGLFDSPEKKDDERFTPYAEAAIEPHGEFNFLIHVPERPRFTPMALWQDQKFHLSRYSDVAGWRPTGSNFDCSLSTIHSPSAESEGHAVAAPGPYPFCQLAPTL